MLQALESDDDLKNFSIGCYRYPTSLHRGPFGKRMAGIQEIASGLRTHIDEHYPSKSKLVLVGHSLGGIIARQYVLDELKNSRSLKVAGIALYASPHTGSSLANIGTFVSSSHHHLRQLCNGSDLLEIINSDWASMKVEESIEAIYVVGGGDRVVEPESAAPYRGKNNIKTLIDYGHTEIIEPDDKLDSRYIVLKNFVSRIRPSNGDSAKEAVSHIKEGDPLFDIYSEAQEPYRVIRGIDQLLRKASLSAHVWVSSQPGLGKTVSLRHLAASSKWKLSHHLLDSFQGLSAIELMREVCLALQERAKTSSPIQNNVNQSDLLKHFRSVISILREDGPFAILIEEIPLADGDEYAAFLNLVYHLALDVELSQPANRVIWLYSSLRDPKVNIRHGVPKVYERVQFIELEKWSHTELRSLIELIENELCLSSTREDRELICRYADGSPRFVKMYYRRRQNEAAATKPITEILESVSKDLA